MFFRAVLAFLALPGTVAFLIPLLLLNRPGARLQLLGIPVLLLGIILLLWCVRDFYVSGKGTLAPWSPPANLVKVGLYRWSRNPMYVAVVTILLGWAILFRSTSHLVYAAFMVIAFHLRVVLYEEPWLARTFGDEFEAYRRTVRRWF